MRQRVGGKVTAMTRRRLEIIALAALILFAAAERPSVGTPATTYQVADFAPQRVETVRDLGLIAVKLAITWID